MMGYTDRHFRYLMRIISPQVLLYTEMYTINDILKNAGRLQFDTREHPLAIQIGGSHPEDLARCAEIVEALGFDEINLNVGCPSTRVQQGKIGACLMKEPELVAECFAAMQQKVRIPVTLKCRLGVDEQESYQELNHFIRHIQHVGCHVFIIHARKAWLKGLNPKQNRDIPPLKYDWVYRIKHDFPKLTIILNGGITTACEIKKHLELVDGVMLGRVAYQNPFLLTELNPILKEERRALTRREIIEGFLPYLDKQLTAGIKFIQVARHLLSLFHGQPGAREWRKTLSDNSTQESQGIEFIENALAALQTK